jgi:hypothetical protein
MTEGSRGSGISHGDIVVCADSTKEWHGWIGIVRGKNKNAIGIEFEEDSIVPQKATGRWIPKTRVVPVAELEHQEPELQTAVARFRQWSTLLAKARESALLAIETYNRPTAVFRTGAFASLMTIAWNSLLLAIIVRRGGSPYEIDNISGAPRIVDGQMKFLGPKDCLSLYFGSDNTGPVTSNIRLFLSLRNQIEHADLPGLDEKVLGEAQAFLRNFEATLRSEFGEKFSINPGLVFPITFTYAPDASKVDLLRAKASETAKTVFEFVDQFRKDLDPNVFCSQEYSFRVFLLPRVGNHLNSADVAMKWLDLDADDPQTVAEIEHHVAALLKVRNVPAHNLEHVKASHVSRRVSDALGVIFHPSSHHAVCCRYLGAWRNGLRPTGPTDCDTRYCVFDMAHGDVVYTQAWVNRLIDKLSLESEQVRILGRPLKRKDDGSTSSQQT